MRPLDPALVRHSGQVRGALMATILTGCVAAAASVVQAGAAAALVARVFLMHTPLAELTTHLWSFAGAWLVRSLAVTTQDVWARHAGMRAVAALRLDLTRAYARTSGNDGATLALLGRGVDALEIYVARYLPQLVLAVLVPLGLGAWIVLHDVWSAAVLLITIPLIPLFMALIGWFTDAAVTRQWAAVGRITDVIDDLFAGLPDLVVFNRAKAQAALLRRLGTDATSATMRVLRISFLSSFALELIATISVAIVALGIGLRLTEGAMTLETGLMILILAPDVYLPIRQVGAQFHAAVDGMEAWQMAAPVLHEPSPSAVLSAERIERVALRELAIGHGAPLHRGITDTLQAGQLTVITGASGTGKTTLLRTIAGLLSPVHGEVLVQGLSVHALTDDAWFSRTGYVPQDPWLGHGTIRDALLRGTSADDARCRSALQAVGLDGLSLEARIDDLGAGVSVGQRRRIAMARAWLRNPEILLLDEPTAAVDAESEAAILRLLDTMRADGCIVVAVAHRVALVQAADHVMHLEVAT